MKIEFKSDVLIVFIDRFTKPVSKLEMRKLTKPIYFESIISAKENICLSLKMTSLGLVSLTFRYIFAINKIVIMNKASNKELIINLIETILFLKFKNF